MYINSLYCAHDLGLFPEIYFRCLDKALNQILFVNISSDFVGVLILQIKESLLKVKLLFDRLNVIYTHRNILLNDTF